MSPPLTDLLRRLRGIPEPFDDSWTAPQRGRWGEAWATRFYHRERGAGILERNWRIPEGEIDLIVRERNVLVFVEVKCRDPRDPEPLAQVRDPKRQRHLRVAAHRYWLRLAMPRPPVRFDALVVTPDPDQPARPHISRVEGILSAQELAPFGC